MLYQNKGIRIMKLKLYEKAFIGVNVNYFPQYAIGVPTMMLIEELMEQAKFSCHFIFCTGPPMFFPAFCGLRMHGYTSMK